MVAALSALDGVSVTEVENGAQALKEACVGSYALLISDVEMPVMSGLQVLRILRASFFSSTELPVIVLTKQDEPLQKVRALTDGANDYVTKPVEPQELLARVRAQLDLRRLHREILAAQALTLHAQKLATVGQLAAAIAHELNTPAQYLCDNLTFLSDSFMELLDTAQGRSGGTVAGVNGSDDGTRPIDLDYLREEIPRSLMDMRSGVLKVAAIVQTIREFADTGSETISVIDVRKTIDTVVELSRSRWLGVADVSTTYDSQVSTVRCYPADIKHAIWQLLVQAADDMGSADPSGTRGRIEVSVGQESGHVNIKVRSNAVRAAGSEPPVTGGLWGERQTLDFARTVIEEKHHGQLTREPSADGWTTAVIKLPSKPPNAA